MTILGIVQRILKARRSRKYGMLDNLIHCVGDEAMARRDRLNEILEIKQRSGRHKRRTFKWDLERLGRMRTSEREDQQLVDELMPARVVTLLEVFVRTWIEELVDKGAPYVERAASLRRGHQIRFCNSTQFAPWRDYDGSAYRA